MFGRENANLAGNVALRSQFGGGTTCNGQKTDEVLSPTFSPFRNIRGDRHGRTLHLVPKSVLSVFLQQFVDPHRKLTRAFPDLQFLE